MKDLGEVRRILGMKLKETELRELSLTQKAYLQKVLQKFLIENKA